jgi:hypothetical protein
MEYYGGSHIARRIPCLAGKANGMEARADTVPLRGSISLQISNRKPSTIVSISMIQFW